MNLYVKQPLGISLHYDETMWHKAIVQGVKPFIKRTKDINSFVLKLDREQGDSIRMTVIPNETANIEMLVKNIDKWFKNFLLNSPSTLSKSLINKESFFLNFKNNTIHYGTFNSNTKLFVSILNSYEVDLSRVLIEIFEFYKEETLSSLTEIFIQLFSIFCNAMHLDDKEALQLFELILEDEYKKYDDIKALKKLSLTNEKNFQENKDDLIEYIKEDRFKDLKDYEEKWEVLWYSVVSDCYISLKGNSDNTKVFSFMIYHLSGVFDLKHRITTYYLFHRALMCL